MADDRVANEIIEDAVSGRRRGPAIAVLIPCLNEAVTVEAVVQDFRKSLPSATVYVYDNNSTDNTPLIAADAGAVVRHEPLQGKGNVVRRMFADIEADIYVLVDGDDTYDAASADTMVRLMAEEGFDLVNGARRSEDEGSFRRGHAFGNALLAGLVTRMFGRPAGDMLSGYKVFSRRFVKSFPVSSSGFEIETELTVHALDLEMPMTELVLPYRERPEGSESKLSTVGDGFRIVGTIVRLVRSERPLAFFTALAGLLAVIAVILAFPLALTFVHTHRVPRFPTAVLATGLMILAFLSMASGLILDTVTRGRREAKVLRYLAVPGPRCLDAGY
jgi:glycosyltransferase involved in cell wall biosynthesis